MIVTSKKGLRENYVTKACVVITWNAWRVSLLDETQYKHINHQKVLWVGVGLEGRVRMKQGNFNQF